MSRSSQYSEIRDVREQQQQQQGLPARRQQPQQNSSPENDESSSSSSALRQTSVFQKFLSLRGDSLITPGGIVASGLSLSSATLGAGTLSLPFAMYSAGAVVGCGFLILCCAATVYSVRVLMIIVEVSGFHTYEVMSRRFIGKWFENVTAGLVFIFCWGIASSYVTAVGDLLSAFAEIDAFPALFKGIWGRRLMSAIFWALLMLPLSLAKHINSLRYASLIGMLCTAFVVGCIAFHMATVASPAMDLGPPRAFSRGGFQVASAEEDGGKPAALKLANFDLQALTALPIIIFGYCCQTNCFEIYGELKDRSVARMTKITAGAMTICTSLYIICGLCGSLAFGSATAGNILSNYKDPTSTWYILVSYLFISFTVTTAFPMCVLPMRDAVLQVMGYTCGADHTQHAEREAAEGGGGGGVGEEEMTMAAARDVSSVADAAIPANTNNRTTDDADVESTRLSRAVPHTIIFSSRSSHNPFRPQPHLLSESRASKRGLPLGEEASTRAVTDESLRTATTAREQEKEKKKKETNEATIIESNDDAASRILSVKSTEEAPDYIRVPISGLLAVICVLVGLFAPEISVFFGLLGGICGSTLSFIWPALFILKLDGRSEYVSRYGSWFQQQQQQLSAADGSVKQDGDNFDGVTVVTTTMSAAAAPVAPPTPPITIFNNNSIIAPSADLHPITVSSPLNSGGIHPHPHHQLQQRGSGDSNGSPDGGRVIVSHAAFASSSSSSPVGVRGGAMGELQRGGREGAGVGVGAGEVVKDDPFSNPNHANESNNSNNTNTHNLASIVGASAVIAYSHGVEGEGGRGGACSSDGNRNKHPSPNFTPPNNAHHTVAAVSGSGGVGGVLRSVSWAPTVIDITPCKVSSSGIGAHTATTSVFLPAPASPHHLVVTSTEVNNHHSTIYQAHQQQRPQQSKIHNAANISSAVHTQLQLVSAPSALAFSATSSNNHNNTAHRPSGTVRESSSSQQQQQMSSAEKLSLLRQLQEEEEEQDVEEERDALPPPPPFVMGRADRIAVWALLIGGCAVGVFGTAVSVYVNFIE